MPPLIAYGTMRYSLWPLSERLEHLTKMGVKSAPVPCDSVRIASLVVANKTA